MDFIQRENHRTKLGISIVMFDYQRVYLNHSVNVYIYTHNKQWVGLKGRSTRNHVTMFLPIKSLGIYNSSIMYMYIYIYIIALGISLHMYVYIYM